jgi:hypothetical protein
MPIPIRRFISIAALLALAAISQAQTAVPIIEQVPNRDSTEYFLRHDEPQQLHVTATNSPTHFEATGVPPCVQFTQDSWNGNAEAVFIWTPGTLTGGAYTVSMTATNAAGTSAPMTFHWIIHPGMIDFIKSDAYEYHPGDTVTFTASFSAPVVVTGTPYIPLWGDKKALYAGGSGTSKLTFTYQVAADDPRVSGYYPEDISAGNGSITTTDGVSASLHDTYQGLNPPPGLKITDPAPAPEAVININVTQRFYRDLYFSFTFTNTITVAGTPRLHFTVGGVAHTAAMTGFSTNSIGFAYSPQPGDNGAVALQSPLDLNGGSITGANGLAANLNFNSPDMSPYVIDTTPPAPPVVTSVTNSGTPTFAGTAEPNSGVAVETATARAGIGAQVGSDGTFNASDYQPNLPPGTYTFYLTATDKAYNTSARSEPVTVTVSYPTTPVTPVITGVDASGNVIGTATPGDWVYLFADGQLHPSGGATTDANGTWSVQPFYYGIVGPTFTVTAVAYDSATDASDRSAPFTYSSSSAVPVTTNAMVRGQVGTAIQPVQLEILSSPTSFSADSTLGNYGLQLSPSGLVTGTPTQPASGVKIAYAASDTAGNSFPGTITLDIAAAPTNGGGSTPQTITFSSPTGAVRVGQPIALGATSSAGLPITYSVVSGDATINGSVLTPQSTATLIVRASSPGDGTYAAASTDVNFGNPIPVGNSRLVNISSRVRVSAGDASGATIAGFYVTGTTPKQILIRAAGPSLTQFGITNPVTAPQLKLYDNKNAVIATNAGWNNDAAISAAATSVAAFKFNANSADAALLMTLAPGLYTAQVQSGNTGTALVEVYDVGSADPNPTKQLINISTRGYVGTDQDVLVAGFVVSGDAPKRILIRGVGPGITQFGVTDVVADPVLKLYDAKQVAVAQNDNWEAPQSIGAGDTPATGGQITAADTAVGAFPLATGSTDAAMIVTLNPGQYTAIVSGANGGTGNAIVEVYEVP